MSTITRRRVAGSSANNDDHASESSHTSKPHDSSSPLAEKKIAYDPRDVDDEKQTPKLTLMEEVLLLGLKDKQGYLSFWNDSISYALRGCIVMELAFRGRIAMVKDPNRRKYPMSDRYIEVINDKLTGEVLLDEALKMMKVSEKMSVASWIDLMSGETWNVMKIGYQLKQVRERLAKGLVDKGVLRTEKRNFLLFDMATHPIADTAIKEEIIKRVCTMLVTRVSSSAIDAQSDVPHAYLRTVSMICAAYAANVLENALLYLQPDLREQAFNKVDELMSDFSTWPFAGSGAKLEVPPGKELSLEVVASVLDVLTKMDAIL
ncbi:Golgi phosphoprotein 3-domain-containing protein [Radiomyces spectabilis]|uniref:Golgi phosphoprotein 3-domain-containing protein n=1 Tax=Radiomyces spectabilis TaxID=64574 RepID=UPI00221F8464|nr:Golgi phosphoprotein 3-domain-containing protein [Radiomyces spectabilis]KAI8365397.1 Golgi phosphoprotein 3-domain-containing protein [Radiomyces spectabilis]